MDELFSLFHTEQVIHLVLHLSIHRENYCCMKMLYSSCEGHYQNNGCV